MGGGGQRVLPGTGVASPARQEAMSTRAGTIPEKDDGNGSNGDNSVSAAAPRKRQLHRWRT